MTVRQLLENTDAQELAEWRAYFAIERELVDAARKPKPEAVNLKDKLKAGLKGKADGGRGKMGRKKAFA